RAPALRTGARGDQAAARTAAPAAGGRPADRPESMNVARRAYGDANVEAEIAPFFRDMASRLKAAHLVIGRSGAGTVCEFAVAGRPSILVPLAIAIDDDQGQNARLLSEAGAAEVAREHQLTVDSLSTALEKLLTNPS